VDIAPPSLEEFDATLAAIGGFETRPLLAAAVSGGPDSMALMLLADHWARTRGGTAWGLTVDHGLRRESAREARTVASWLAARAIPHAILPWIGAKPAAGIQEAAREARYRLLTAWCRDRGVLHLLAAHHFEDQIETYLIRRRSGSGVEGLAGMAAVRELRGCRLVRPLLAMSRTRLAALLAAEGQPFLRDPSNLNPAFERVRLRLAISKGSPPPLLEERVGVRKQAEKRLPLLLPGSSPTGPAILSREAAKGRTGRAVEPLADEVRACARERIAREQALAVRLARAVALHPAGFGVLDPALLAAADPVIAARLLGRVVLCLGGLRYPARAARLARLRAALVAEPGRARTLGGCRFVPWRGRWLVLRELALAEAPAALEAGAALCWDRRYAVRLAPGAAGACMIGYLGQHEGAAPESGFRRALPPLVHSALPAFWDGEGVVAVPHLGYVRPGPWVLPRLSFRPANPLTPPAFTVV
jgi:tRNA(Ile)-lysidine synthase